MKRLFVALLVIILACSLLAGCGTKEKIEQKMGEKIAEEVVEKALGDKNTDIDIDGDKITVKDKEGGTLTLGIKTENILGFTLRIKKGEHLPLAAASGRILITYPNLSKAKLSAPPMTVRAMS